jgi:uncharacterized phage-like protein YoqJ
VCLGQTQLYVSPPNFAVYKMQVRNEWMVNHANILLALWDGSTGGTYNCIQYAMKKNHIEIINLWGEFMEKQ